jgi:sugar O-acyltransferase (sialic acid O-acetyltransferase NeuD family)
MMAAKDTTSLKKNIYLVGGGGHCVSCIDVIESTNEFLIQGIFDQAQYVGQKVLGYPIIGTDADIAKYISKDNFFLLTVGQIQSAQTRQKIAGQIDSLKGQFATVISSRAYVSKHAALGPGTIVMHDVVVNANSRIGAHCILNTKSLVEHDACVENFCHISTGAIVNGTVMIESESFVGSGAVVKHSVTVPAKSLIQAGDFYKGKI